MVVRNPELLEDWELIAILFGKGIQGKNIEVLSKELLLRYSGLVELFHTPPSILFKEKGIGKAKIASILAVRELLTRIDQKILESKQSSPFSEKELLKHLSFRSKKEPRECFYLVSFSNDKSIIRIELISRGSLMEIGVHTRDLVKLLLDDSARFALIAHNHPRQSCIPSPDDWNLFNNLKQILLPLEIELLDQWVIGKDGAYSCNKDERI